MVREPLPKFNFSHCKHWTNLEIFFHMAVSLLTYVATFPESFIFGEATSSHFFKVTNSTQQLLFRRSYFFRAATFFEELLFQNNRFFPVVIFQYIYFFRADFLPRSHFLRIGSSLGELLCWKSSFLVEELVQDKDIYRTTTFLKQVILYSINIFRRDTFLTKVLLLNSSSRTVTFWKKVIFQKSNISKHLLFLESHFFRETTFSKDLTFHSSYCFRTATFSQRTFPEDVLFHSHTSFLQLHFLFIR